MLLLTVEIEHIIKELLEMKSKISAFPSNVILYFRLVKRFFSDEYVNLNTRLTDSMTDVMAHASLGTLFKNKT